MKRFLISLLFCFSVSANAGYSASITSSNNGYFTTKPMSACYLTLSIAIASVLGSNYNLMVIDVINTTASTWHSYGSGGTWQVSGAFVACSTNPASGPATALAGGVSDPAISGGSVSGGSGGSGSPTTITMESPFEPEAFELAVGAALLLFVTGLGVGFVMSIVRKLRYG